LKREYRSKFLAQAKKSLPSFYLPFLKVMRIFQREKIAARIHLPIIWSMQVPVRAWQMILPHSC